EKRAAAARERGNHARAALLGARLGGEAHARADVAALAERLARALAWAEAPVEAWTDALLPLVARARGAARLPWNVAGQLVYDLQKACVDREREVFTVGVGTWLVSFGRRPLRRSLPAQREVRIVKRVRAAARKLARVRLGVAERAALAALVTEMLERAERNLRAAVEPRIEAALRKVGLAPANAAERVAAHKVVLELTDGVVDKGFTALGPLRDALSRGHLKLPNLSLGDLYRGDALLRIDRILSRTLDGVYRRGEAYLRALQILSSILFGTSVGRLLVLYVVLPLAGTYLVLEGSHHMVAPVLHVVGAPEPPPFLTWPSFAITLAVLFGLLHSALVRRAAWAGLCAVGRALRAVLWRAPRWLFTRPLVRAMFRSAPVVAFGRFVLKPALLAAPLAALVPALGLEPVVWGPLLGGAFLGWNVLLNSKPGVLLEEVVLDFALRQWRMVSQRILPGILLAIVDVFRRALVGLDRLMYAVDERLRFRQGEGRVALVVKGILGTVWAVLRYIVRLWVNLFLEPEVNPVKHFPTVAVAAKIVLPLKVALHEAARHALVPTLGPFLTELLVLPNLLVMPGFFGFLVWELQGNWRLYGQNRKPALGPVVLGHHGEGMPRLLRPGFHSGTVPKAFAKLRRASQKGHGSALKHRETLRQVEHALHHFAERELVALLRESGAFVRALSVGHVRLTSNRVRLPLESPELGPEPVELAFEEQSGWIVASVARRGWLEALDGAALMAFENALAGFYKLAAVDFVREQLEAALGPGVPYDLASEGLVVWPDGSYATEVVYDLRATGTLRPHTRFGSAPARPLEASALRFVDEPVTWRAWVDSWSQQGTRRVLHGASLLPAGLEARSVHPWRREPRS
ncbi:MAG: hypothetical protein HY908_32105, partial [Myxococcales bacterium]|nr:hypothetical protein [Myxococcales bacterium]